MSKNEEVVKLRNEYCKEMTITISSERFKCNLCDKMFKGAHFVINHINNKHLSIIIDNIDKKYCDKIKKKNFFNNQNKNYERIKIMSSMDEYYSYLNAMKKYQSYDNKRFQGGYFYNRDRDRDRERERDRESYRDRDRDRDRYQRGGGYAKYREYKDYDQPEKKGNTITRNERKLVSYDDL